MRRGTFGCRHGFVAAVVAGAGALASQAWAQDAPSAPVGFGVGAETTMDTFAGPGVTSLSGAYNAGPWHGSVLLGAADQEGQSGTLLQLGGRAYYHMHASADADLGIGGGLILVHVPGRGNGDSADVVYVEVGAQIRAFLTPNVALSASAGAVIMTADANGFLVTGQALGAFGLHYYFF